MPFFVLLAIGATLLTISYLLMPKPKQPKPGALQDMESPTAEAGREVPVPFGTITIKSPNVLDFGDRSIRTYEVNA